MNKDSNNYLKSLEQFVRGLIELYEKREKAYKDQLSSFFAPLILRYKLMEEFKKQTDRYLASDFNLLEIISPDENKVSDIIAELLKPNGKHGQGKIFLEKFIETLRKFTNLGWIHSEILNASQVTVEREHFTNKGRRLDILLKFPKNQYIIGIENKLWADEQRNQLTDYAKYLDKVSNGKFLLVYLDGLGRKATSINPKFKEELERDGRFVELSYHNFLIPWLKECSKECEAEKVRWFLRDFIAWIKRNLKEVNYGGSSKEGNY